MFTSPQARRSLKAKLTRRCSTDAFISASPSRFLRSETVTHPCPGSDPHQFLQPSVLIPQLLRFLRLVDIHPSVLCLPRVQSVLADAHFPRHILGLPPCFHLLQRTHHLRFRVPAYRHP